LISGEQKFPMSSMTMFQGDRLFHDRSRSRRCETRRQEFLSLNVQTFAVEGDPQSVPSADVPTHSKIFLDFETV
jgi:hypothetical protein